jgi:hypothetical protein
MARPLRLEFPGAIYHVTSRGNACLPIFEKDQDRKAFLAIVQEAFKRFNWLLFACVQTVQLALVCLLSNEQPRPPAKS